MRTNIVVSIITILFSAFFLIQTGQIVERETDATLSSTFWPTFLLSSMLVLGIILLVKTIIQQKTNRADAAEEQEGVEAQLDDSDFVDEAPAFPNRLWLMIAISFAYVILLPLVGFILSSLVILVAITLLMGVKKWSSLVLTSVLGTAFLTFLFINLLRVPLPRGVGIFRDLSLLIY
ncbi:tripartite tricarboxylate transporter TctB family protein [Halalkalibacter oceani]|uniref:tripartite tricarboxylate transporter TctB family protein n=1 Tax=Halalkalibacter oceani TaxID=1653776 RepID=UPI003391C06D